METLSGRIHPRLKGYNYSADGAYFITFCIKDGHDTLGKIVVGHDAPGAPSSRNAPDMPYMQLSEYGTIIHKEIMGTPSHYHNVTIDKFVVMPNHVHMIIVIRNGDGAPRASRPTNALIPSIVAMLKKKTNKMYEFTMWQDSYHDHIIRNEEEYRKIWKYIDENPRKWKEDRYYND